MKGKAKGKTKNLAALHAPKNPAKVRHSRDHVGGWPKLKSPRVGGKRGQKKIAKKIRKA
jgi:hypothetical protein